MNGKLLAFAAGVALTALVHVGALWGTNKRWEMEMVNYGCGYWEWNVHDKKDWMGNQPLRYHWYGEPKPAKRTDQVEI